MTKRKLALKITSAVIAFAIIGFLLFVLNAFVGNPISSAIAKSKIEQYVSQNYDTNEYTVGKVSYEFKFNEYIAKVTSNKSKDSYFNVSYRNGKIRDSYESNVVRRFNTWVRLNDEISKQVKEIIQKEYSYDLDYALTMLGKSDKEMESLILDMPLDIHNPPLPVNLSIAIYTDNPSEEETKKAMVEAYRIMQKYNIPISTYSVYISKPKDPDKNVPYTGDYSLYDIPVSEVEKMAEHF